MDICASGEPVGSPTVLEFARNRAAIAVGQDLHDTLMSFRAKYGWGRVIAAPQIGVLKRIV